MAKLIELHHSRFLQVAALACMLLTGIVSAEEIDKGKASDAAAVAKAPKCYHGCERWGQMCNVDPRGVYKCQRRCEKFGEICE